RLQLAMMLSSDASRRLILMTSFQRCASNSSRALMTVPASHRLAPTGRELLKIPWPAYGTVAARSTHGGLRLLAIRAILVRCAVEVAAPLPLADRAIHGLRDLRAEYAGRRLQPRDLEQQLAAGSGLELTGLADRDH